MRATAGKLCWLIVLLGLACGRAAQAGNGWVLALTWHPGFCAARVAAQECGRGNTPRLVLHGLWGENRDVAYCGVGGHAVRDRAWCRLPELKLSPFVSDALDGAMPGRAACLDRHEWAKHGTCSGLSANDYFDAATRLTILANGLKIAALLRQRAGGTVTLEELRDRARADAGDLERAFIFVCRHRDGLPYLSEVRIALRNDGLALFPARESLRRPSSRGGGCPSRDIIRVDSPS